MALFPKVSVKVCPTTCQTEFWTCVWCSPLISADGLGINTQFFCFESGTTNFISLLTMGIWCGNTEITGHFHRKQSTWLEFDGRSTESVDKICTFYSQISSPYFRISTSTFLDNCLTPRKLEHAKWPEIEREIRSIFFGQLPTGDPWKFYCSVLVFSTGIRGWKEN